MPNELTNASGTVTTERPRASRKPQELGQHQELAIDLPPRSEIAETDVYKHWKSVASNHEGIVVDPNINYGSPVSEGAMIPVSRIIGYLYATGDLDRLLRDFPDLDEDKVKHAVLYAVDLLGG